MGAPDGHPFFGNQYTDGGYEPGSFTYATAEILESVLDSIREAVAEKSIKPEAINLSPFEDVDVEHSSNIALIIAGGLAVFAAIGGLLWWRRKRKISIEKETLQSIELSSVGICIKCSKPLSESVYVPENKANYTDAYIVCKSCGEKDFARYSNENGLL